MDAAGEAEQGAPLLQGQGQGQGQGQEDASLSSSHEPSTLKGVYVQNAMLGPINWTVQGLALALVALVWSLVLSAMPLTPLPLFGYHPMIQSLAFLMLLQSILTLQPTSQARRNEKQLGFRVHRLVNLALVLPLFTVGASIMWYLHDQPGQKHFISWHGILGTVIIAWAWLQVAFGIVVTSFDGNLVGGISNAKALWKHHRLSGYLLLPALAVVVYLGAAQTSWSQMSAGTVHHTAVLLCLLGITIGLFARVQRSKLPKL